MRRIRLCGGSLKLCRILLATGTENHEANSVPLYDLVLK